MKLTETELSRLLDEAAEPVAPGTCPPAEMFRRVADGEAARREREAFADHLISCRDCAEQFRAVGDVRSWAEQASARVLPSAPRARRVPVWAASLAAVVLLGAAAGLLVLRSSVRPVAEERGAVAPASAIDPAEQALLADAPVRLAWTPIAGAREYSVTLYDFESTPIWESRPVADPRVSLPAAVRQRLAAGGEFYWRVTARQGIDRVGSELHRFRVSSSKPQATRP